MEVEVVVARNSQRRGLDPAKYSAEHALYCGRRRRAATYDKYVWRALIHCPSEGMIACSAYLDILEIDDQIACARMVTKASTKRQVVDQEYIQPDWE